MLAARRRWWFSALLVAVLGLAATHPAAGSERLALRHVQLTLPGAPSKVVPADVDGDGRKDLVVVVAYTEIEEIGDDRFEGMVQIATVIPALFDRRELRVYLARGDGGYVEAGAPLDLPPSVLHLEAGPPGAEAVALTDGGLSRLRLDAGDAGPTLRFEPLVEDSPLLAGTGSFYASLRLVHELNGDGIPDFLLPTSFGLAVYLGTPAGLSPTPAHRIELPGPSTGADDRIARSVPLPEVRHVDGDAYPDLVFGRAFDESHKARFHVLRGSSDGRFAPLRREPLDCHDRLTDLRMTVSDPNGLPWPESLAAFRDLDGDRRAEAVLVVERPRGEGMRKEMKDAKRPVNHYAFHRLGDDLAIRPEPYFEMDVLGHGIEFEDDEIPIAVEQFQDLDGDGREDLVTVTLDFSLLQAVKILATKKIGIGLDFHVRGQEPDGSFREVPDLDLSEKLKLDLDDLEVGSFAQFAGDFDGDGSQDFVHLGRGRRVTLHAGRPGCRYPRDPDLAIELAAEPESLDRVRIEDLDGDGRSDLRITRPLPATEADASAPVRLDLYLTGGSGT